MEKEKLAPYKLALKLKEKGYNYTAFAFYDECEELFFNTHKEMLYNNDRFLVAAPLWSDITDWLFEYHNIFIYPVKCDWEKIYIKYKVNDSDTLFNSLKNAINYSLDLI